MEVIHKVDTGHPMGALYPVDEFLLFVNSHYARSEEKSWIFEIRERMLMYGIGRFLLIVDHNGKIDSVHEHEHNSAGFAYVFLMNAVHIFAIEIDLISKRHELRLARTVWSEKHPARINKDEAYPWILNTGLYGTSNA